MLCVKELSRKTVVDNSANVPVMLSQCCLHYLALTLALLTMIWLNITLAAIIIMDESQVLFYHLFIILRPYS